MGSYGSGRLVDQAGQPVGGPGNPLNVEGRDTREVLEMLLAEMKVMNLHLAVLTDNYIEEG